MRGRKLLENAFRELTDVSKVNSHSLGAGGATFAINTGAFDQVFKRNGPSVSKNAKDGKDEFSFISVIIFKN